MTSALIPQSLPCSGQPLPFRSLLPAEPTNVRSDFPHQSPRGTRAGTCNFRGSRRGRRYVPGLRWWICGLLFFATTINYVDRQSLSVLKTMLEKQMNWSEADYGWIQFAFTAAYAAFPSIAGRVIDTVG